MSNVDVDDAKRRKSTGSAHATVGGVGDTGMQTFEGNDDNGCVVQDRDLTRSNSLVASTTPSRTENEKKKAQQQQQQQSHSSAPAPSPPPFQARFWSNDPVTSVKRRLYFRVVGSGTFLMIICIFTLLAIFWGSLYNVNDYIHKLEGWVIDFDGGPIGQTVIQAFQNNTGLPFQMTWRIVNASQFPNYLSDVEEAVVKEKTWVAVSINRGASANLSAAIANVDSSYDGSLAVTAHADEARNEQGYASFIQPAITQILLEASQAFALQNSQQVAANSSVNYQALLSRAPTVLTLPLSFTINNLRPFDVPVALAVDFVGLIYLLIIAFVVCMMNYQARVIVSGLNRHLQLGSLIAIRLCVPLVLYFFVSAFFSMLSLAFQAPFNRVFGHSGFVIYWMMNWMGMCALGLAMESMITILTPSFTPFFLMLWIISNVSVASVPIEVLPGVFGYGYAAPFYNVSKTVRTILFNTKNDIGLNFGVQFAWIAVSLVTMTLLTILMRRKEERAWRAQQDDATRDKEKV